MRAAIPFIVILAGLVFAGGFSAASGQARLQKRPGAVAPFATEADPGCESNSDRDGDGLDDGCEGRLLNDHAPLLHMPFLYDWIRPANVDWYLARTHMRFHHNNCSDDAIAGVGAVSQANLLSFRHKTKKGLSGLCRHGSTSISSGAGPWSEDEHFFLQPPDDAVHKGSDNPADWKVYGHAFPNAIGGVNLQYWFFYPYNDNGGPINHESDWESLMVRLRADRSIDGVYFCLHGACDTFRAPGQLAWTGKHVEAWVADGSHASYPSQTECDSASFAYEAGGPNCTSLPEHRWFTWSNGKGAEPGYQGWGIVNVGERGAPLNGQAFIDYGGGVWGEQGTWELTSGKRTPSFQANWNQDRAD